MRRETQIARVWLHLRGVAQNFSRPQTHAKGKSSGVHNETLSVSGFPVELRMLRVQRHQKNSVFLLDFSIVRKKDQ